MIGQFAKYPIENISSNVRLIIDDCDPHTDNVFEEIRDYLEVITQLSQWIDYDLFVNDENHIVLHMYGGPQELHKLTFSAPNYAPYNSTMGVDWVHEGF